MTQSTYGSSYPSQDIFQNIVSRYSKGKAKPIKKSLFKAFETGAESPESAADAIRTLGQVYNWKPGKTERIARKLGSAQPGPIAPERYGSLSPIVESTYKNIFGRSATPDEIARNIALAGSYRISPNDPGAFASLMSDLALASPEGQSKYKTEADIAWEQEHGSMPRTATGELMRGLTRFDPSRISEAVNLLMG